MDELLEREIEDLQDKIVMTGFTCTNREAAFIYHQTKKLGRYRYSKTLDFNGGKARCLLDFAIDNGIILQGYHASLKNQRGITHGFFAGIDTAAIEKEMASINWFVPEQNFGLIDKLDHTFSTLLQSGKDALEIVEQLQVKYWAGTQVEEIFNLSELKDKYEPSHYFSINNDISDINIQSGCNLLTGKPVMLFKEFAANHFQPFWFLLKPERSLFGKITFGEQRYPAFDLKKEIDKLPLYGDGLEEGYRIFMSLIEGNPAQTTINKGGEKIKASVLVDAETQSLLLYDGMNKRINLEQHKKVPDNNPEQVKELNSPKQKLIKRQPGKNKGRGM